MIMRKDNKLFTLYLFYGINFISMGMTTFAPKFYGDIGLTDGRIGLISSVTALVGLFMQPFWGILADRSRYKRSIVVISLILAGVMCYLVLPASAQFVPLLLVLLLQNTFYLPVSPVGNSICIEYTAEHGHSFGPVRMMGTIGYQVGILATGFLLSGSLRGLYPAMGTVLLLAAAAAAILPDVRGHQHGGGKVSFAEFTQDKNVLLLFLIVFLASIGHQFNLSFFSKHLGDLGVGNTVTGFINTLSVILEIPFLLFADRLMRRFSIWRWLQLGLLTGAVRFFLLSVLRAPGAIVLAQMLSIFHLSCFEFIPFMYLGKVCRRELQASAQCLYQMISFGAARIVGTLLGGFIADRTGIPFVYGLWGSLMLLTLLLFFHPLQKRAGNEVS